MRLTQKAFAHHVGIQQPRVAKLVAAGVLDLKRGLDQSRLDYIEHLRQAAAGRGGDGDYDLQAERARLAHHQANIAAMQERETAAALVPVGWYLDAITAIAAVLHSRLGILVSRVAASVPGLSQDVLHELRQGIQKARLDIADACADVLNDHRQKLPEYEEKQNAND